MLTVDQLEAAVVDTFHHNRLQAIILPGVHAFVNIVEQACHLRFSPAVATLVCRDKKHPFDIKYKFRVEIHGLSFLVSQKYVIFVVFANKKEATVLNRLLFFI